jgi:isopentenyl-diphosphate Delta-isomerase
MTTTSCLPLSPTAGPPPRAAAAAAADADARGELLDVLDEHGRVLSSEPREVVHARGLRHRVAHVLLLRRASSGASARAELLLARRAAGKAVGPRLWDLSVAEHVAAGEDAAAAAARGLVEELGVRIDPARIHVVAVDVPLHFVHEEAAVRDNELVTLFVAAYRGPEKDGPVMPDAVEVAETAWFPIHIVDHLTATKDHIFTPWMLRQLRTIDLAALADQAFSAAA